MTRANNKLFNVVAIYWENLLLEILKLFFNDGLQGGEGKRGKGLCIIVIFQKNKNMKVEQIYRHPTNIFSTLGERLIVYVLYTLYKSCWLNSSKTNRRSEWLNNIFLLSRANNQAYSTSHSFRHDIHFLVLRLKQQQLGQVTLIQNNQTVNLIGCIFYSNDLYYILLHSGYDINARMHIILACKL